MPFYKCKTVALNVLAFAYVEGSYQSRNLHIDLSV